MSATKKIIIVDDDDMLRETLKEQFSLHDEFMVTEAATATAGVKAVKADHADLVILDVNLPDMDGREACKIMRRNGYKGPVVMLTAQGSELSVGQAATVAYEPRQGTVGALQIKVTRLREASFDEFVGWKLDKKIKQTTPYFVDAKVTNVGDTDLGGRPVPLYIVDGQNRLIEASIFTATLRCSRMCSATNTRPIAPSPSSRMRR